MRPASSPTQAAAPAPDLQLAAGGEYSPAAVGERRARVLILLMVHRAPLCPCARTAYAQS